MAKRMPMPSEEIIYGSLFNILFEDLIENASRELEIDEEHPYYEDFVQICNKYRDNWKTKLIKATLEANPIEANPIEAKGGKLRIRHRKPSKIHIKKHTKKHNKKSKKYKKYKKSRRKRR